MCVLIYHEAHRKMSIVIVAKYLKNDQFNNPMFMCAPTDEGFKVIDACFKKIKSLNLSTYLPIYQHPTKKYVTITYRFNDSRIKKFTDKSIYKLTTNIRTIEREGKKFINCEIVTAVVVEYYKPADRGEAISFDGIEVDGLSLHLPTNDTRQSDRETYPLG